LQSPPPILSNFVISKIWKIILKISQIYTRKPKQNPKSKMFLNPLSQQTPKYKGKEEVFILCKPFTHSSKHQIQTEERGGFECVCIHKIIIYSFRQVLPVFKLRRRRRTDHSATTSKSSSTLVATSFFNITATANKHPPAHHPSDAQGCLRLLF
jgi:hypothetical protein